MSKPSTTVAVACKLPNGLNIDHKGKTVYIPGGRVALDENGNPIVDRPTPGGYGIAFGVDAEWWDDWMATTGKNWPPVVNGVVFALPSAEDTMSVAKSQKDVVTGVEGVNAPSAAKTKPGDLSEMDASPE